MRQYEKSSGEDQKKWYGHLKAFYRETDNEKFGLSDFSVKVGNKKPGPLNFPVSLKRLKSSATCCQKRSGSQKATESKGMKG